jgi:Amt family ammonium transporter
MARFGGDEFGILVAAADSVRDVTRVAERLATALASPFSLRGREYFISASVGIAIGDGTEPPEALIRDSDLAMYRAKERGRGRYELFDQLMRARAVDQLRTENDLRRALEREELVIHYQPVVSLASGEISGFEALVRWQHPERGLLAPGEFIPLAEESELIVDIGERVLRLACQQAAAWDRERPDGPPIGISVNISPRQVADRTLPERVKSALDESGIEPERLSLEVTETVLVDELESPMQAFGLLKDLGVGLVLDDFGTGFSSLGYLQRFPFDQLKIDRSFVSHLESNPANAAIVKSVTAIAEALGLGVVAEGVETEAQLRAITELGCHQVQGFLFSRPVPPEQAIRLLDEMPAKTPAGTSAADVVPT